VALRTAGPFRRASKVIPGGVNSPVRAWGAVGAGDPFFVARGEGAYLWDAEGNRYIDWVLSWGPLVFGHADPEIVEAVQEAAADGTTFGAPTEREVELAEEIADAVPSVEKVRLVSSGTEAAMSALRLARGVTGRDRIVKFSGCYHGHADALLAAAGSGLATLGIPSSPGVPARTAADTIVCAFNDVEGVTAAVERHGDEIAAIIVEPVAGNMGVVPPEPGFLESLRAAADDTGALLVFDEVITGFRVARGGAQELYGVAPDLTVLGKIAGGGLPLAAFGGRADVMELLAPTGPVYQAGTLSGNPLATAAALVTLRRLRDPGVYTGLEEAGARLEAGLRAAAADEAVCVQRVGAMATLFFHEGPVRSFEDAAASDTDRYGAWFRHLLARGIYVAPSQFEALFVSTAHGETEIDATVEAARELFGG
jgi:glutamate-1-semialdehyde 2,1-aminomutase